MDDTTAFERQLSGEFEDLMGPVRPVDDRAVFDVVAAANRSQRWAFTMFSVLKYVAAGAIVALFGGFLLAGVLTTQDGGETAPAGVTESPSPLTSDEVLPGVTLAVEEVEPGVYRVLSDKARNLVVNPGSSLVTGGDGSIWLLEGDGFYRLGGDMEGLWPEEAWHSETYDFEVAPGGTVWAAWERGGGQTDLVVYSHRGTFGSVGETASESGWEMHPVGGHGDAIDITSDGTVWALAGDPAYLGSDGWWTVAERPYFSGLYVTDAGDIWAFGPPPTPPRRFVDGAWQEHDAVDLDFLSRVDVGPDGTVWGISGDENDFADQVIRFDGSGWQEWEPPDWLAPDHHDWRWDGDEWVAATEYADENLGAESLPGDLRVAPDGSAWVISRLGTWGDQPVCTDDIGGIARFDGETWSRYLRDQCVESMDIAGDGSVWLLATESDARYPIFGTYVITPEAVAAAE